jgi:hypothetical protein
MASRETYSLKHQWEYPSYNRHRHDRHYPALNTYSKPTQNILRLKSMWHFTIRKFIHGTKYERAMFILDNVKIPFNKLIGCRVTKHNWYYMHDEERAFCTKCHKGTGHISREQWNRMGKLKQIKKRTKK